MVVPAACYSIIWKVISTLSLATAVTASPLSSSSSSSPSASSVLYSPSHPAAATIISRPDLPWGDVNLLIVTDVHSWIGGHARHQEHSLWNESVELNLDYGDVLSFYQQLQQYAHQQHNHHHQQKNLFFVMNGDFTDGTGLTTYPPTKLCQLLETMPWDAINIGNHELYRNSTVEGLQQDFIDFWKGRYLTSNVLSSVTHEPLGHRFIYLRGPTATVLTFGFLYNMMGNCAAAIVEPVQQVIQQAWFRQVLRGQVSNGHFDAILVLAHMDYLDPLVTDVLLPAIRYHVGPDMPVQFVTGHSHIRGFAQLDSYSTTLEAGRYLDTLGFVSFPMHSTVIQGQHPSASNQTNITTINDASTTKSNIFQHVMIDANRDTLRSILNQSDFTTPDGMAFSKRIHETQEEMGLLQPLGCSPNTYYVEHGLDDDRSLWNLYVQQVVPLALFAQMHHDHLTPATTTTSKHLPIFVQGTGAFRYDLFQGEVIMDDIIAVCPFRDAVYQIIPFIRGDKLNAILNGQLPQNAISGELPLVDDQVYQLLTVDFDLKYWTQRILNLTGSPATPIPIVDAKTKEEVTTTQLWIDFVRTQWSNASCSTLDVANSSSSSGGDYGDGSVIQNDGNGVFFLLRLKLMFLWGLMALTLILLLVFLRRRIMCLALMWRYRQGYRIPLEKQGEGQPSTSKNESYAESPTEHDSECFHHDEGVV